MSQRFTRQNGSRMDRSHAWQTLPSATLSTCPDPWDSPRAPAPMCRETTSTCGRRTRVTTPKSTHNCRVSPRVASITCTIRVPARLREVSVSLSRNPLMKTKIAAAGVVALLVLAAPACTDLTEAPSSAITPENFYRNADEALGGLASVYAQLRQTNENYYNISEISTDEMIVPTRGQDWYDNGKWLDIHRQTFTANSAAGLDLINNAWVDLFTGIARANVVLNGISTVNFTGKAGIVAELRTLRAFYYYLLMDAFGGVPIVTDPAIALRPQNTRAEV